MDNERFKNYSIELDCAPGFTRPNDLIPEVLYDTGLKIDDFETGNPFFGHQIWLLKTGSKERDELFTYSKPLFRQRITDLYKQGKIRYGTW